MNDVSSQSTPKPVWHEGDTEHFTIKLKNQLSNSFPVKMNYYGHFGGYTREPSEAWWSASSNNSYSGIQEGYSDQTTHPHIWVAKNSHAMYNRYDKVFSVDIKLIIDQFKLYTGMTDNVDYGPGGAGDYYFEYDLLIKLGEIENCMNCSPHTSFYHSRSKDPAQAWLAYPNYIGEFWEDVLFGVYFKDLSSGRMPPFRRGWQNFELGINQQNGDRVFGNEPVNLVEKATSTINYVQDPASGD